jgi:hypothetical protein
MGSARPRIMTTQLTTLALDDLQSVTGGDPGGNHDNPSRNRLEHPPTPKPMDPILPPAAAPTLPSGHYIGNTYC